jgi:hypothetical protein
MVNGSRRRTCTAAAYANRVTTRREKNKSNRNY